MSGGGHALQRLPPFWHLRLSRKAKNFVCLTIRFKNPLTPYLSGGVNGDVNGGVNDGVKTLSESLKPVYSTVFSNPGIKANNVAALLDRPLPTVEKQLATLKKKGLIEYRGSAKTGGYYAKE